MLQRINPDRDILFPVRIQIQQHSGQFRRKRLLIPQLVHQVVLDHQLDIAVFAVFQIAGDRLAVRRRQVVRQRMDLPEPFGRGSRPGIHDPPDIVAFRRDRRDGGRPPDGAFIAGTSGES